MTKHLETSLKAITVVILMLGSLVAGIMLHKNSSDTKYQQIKAVSYVIGYKSACEVMLTKTLCSQIPCNEMPKEVMEQFASVNKQECENFFQQTTMKTKPYNNFKVKILNKGKEEEY